MNGRMLSVWTALVLALTLLTTAVQAGEAQAGDNESDTEGVITYIDGGNVSAKGLSIESDGNEEADIIRYTAGEGYIDYQPATGNDPAVLTLHNATIELDSDSILAPIWLNISSSVKIVLEESNIISCSQYSPLRGQCYGIVSTNDVIITEASTGGSLNFSEVMCGIVSHGTVTIEGGEIDASNAPMGISADKGLEINGGTLNTPLVVTEDPSAEVKGYSGVVMTIKPDDAQEYEFTFSGSGSIDPTSIAYLAQQIREEDSNPEPFYFAIEKGVTLEVGNTTNLPLDRLTNSGSVTIDSGGSLTVTEAVTNSGTITIDSGSTLTVTKTLTNSGTIDNNGSIILPAGTTPEAIRKLGITGDGSVSVPSADGSVVYTNQGMHPVRGDLTLYTGTPNQGIGYGWDGSTLKLDNVAIDGSVTLPENNEVTIETVGESTIKHLVFQGGQVTFKGTAPLTITAGTEDRGTPTATAVTVNSSLTAAADTSGGAIQCGSLTIGSTGTVTVSGNGGVNTKAFSIKNGGKFHGSCNDYNIMVTPAGGETAQCLSLPTGYLPAGFVLQTVSDGSGSVVTVARQNAALSMVSGVLTGAGGQLDLLPPSVKAADTAVETRVESNDDGDDTPSTYLITVKERGNGALTVSPKRAVKGDTVTITAMPDEGAYLAALTVTRRDGTAVDVTETDGKYTFTMPAGTVTITGTFAATPVASSATFTDVSEDSYYASAVRWAVENGITTGVTDNTFDPNGKCTRAQIVTFLYRLAGSPASTGSKSSFSDVAEGSYYASAVRWAVENGVTSGISGSTFDPGGSCTRAQAVTFLYRCAGAPAPTDGVSTFSDVTGDSYYASAVRWAVENGITTGVTANAFNPGDSCTRAQIVTFLYRWQS